MSNTGTTTTSTAITEVGSPRGPGIEVALNMHDTLSSMAQEGYRAIQELERVLFFTDVKEDTNRQRAAQEGLNALEDLQQLLFVSSIDMEDAEHNQMQQAMIKATPSFGSSYGKEASGCTHLGCYSIGAAAACVQGSTGFRNNGYYSDTLVDENALVVHNANMNVMDLLKAHFTSVLKSSQKAWKEMEQAGQKVAKEAERKLLFTDLDDTKMTDAKAPDSGDVWKEVEVILQDMEKKFATFAVETAQPAMERGQRAWKDVGRQSHEAYKECERTLLFTDLDETALAEDKTQDDVISHFVNSQTVFKELQQKLFRTKLSGSPDEVETSSSAEF